jgi:Leucine-rich repeat (LRR) protein
MKTLVGDIRCAARTLLFAAFFTLALAACSDVFGPAPRGTCATLPDSALVAFADPALERAVRRALAVSPQLPLTCGLVERITNLDAAGAGIASLEGIENLTNLQVLWIRANEIADISPLATLTGLTSLNLAANRISDIGPLAGLTSLQFLAINDNGAIADLRPLAGLTNLEGTLWLGGNAITSLSPLRSLARVTGIRAWRNQLRDLDGLQTLAGLRTLNLWGNRITDVSALGALSALEVIDLDFNPDLADIGPLLANPDIGARTHVSLVGTSVSCADVAALRARGAAVVSGCS